VEVAEHLDLAGRRDVQRASVPEQPERGVQAGDDLYRLGASSLLNDILMQLRKERTGAYQSGDYFTID